MVRNISFIFYFLLTILTFVYSKPFKIQSRIIGGHDAEYLGQFPYIASIRTYSNQTGFCSGTIVTYRHVVTAAHCLLPFQSDLESIYLVVGTLQFMGDGQVLTIERSVLHPYYNEKFLFNDICVLKTAQSIKFSAIVKPIALPTINLLSLGGVETIVSGWGTSIANGLKFKPLLQYQRTVTMNKSNCLKYFLQHLSPYVTDVKQRDRIFDEMICAATRKGEGICNGDSGSAMISRILNGFDVFIGVASWAVNCADGFPDVYTSVYHHLDFINQQISS